MTHTEEWSVSRGDEKRHFLVLYFDDLPERTEAISFFQDNDCGVYRVCPVTDELWAMTPPDAQNFLASNPTHTQIESLYIRSRTRTITDSDLTRLKYIPEIRHLHILSKAVTDAGIVEIEHLTRLQSLVVYSPLVTDNCLKSILKLDKLECVDLQGSPGITSASMLTHRLPHLDRFWPPHNDKAHDRTMR